jgi:hypothetical protein
MQTKSLEKRDSRVIAAHIQLNPWLFLWATVGAWLWYGALHLAHIV